MHCGKETMHLIFNASEEKSLNKKNTDFKHTINTITLKFGLNLYTSDLIPCLEQPTMA